MNTDVAAILSVSVEFVSKRFGVRVGNKVARLLVFAKFDEREIIFEVNRIVSFVLSIEVRGEMEEVSLANFARKFILR